MLDIPLVILPLTSLYIYKTIRDNNKTGAYSVFHQVAYDLRQPTQAITQACLFSNAAGVQPKTPNEAQSQFNALLEQFDIAADLPPETKMHRLREIPAPILLKHAIVSPYHQYRPTTDGSFIDPALFANLHSGVFARECRQRHIRFFLGECRDEPKVYSLWFPPREDTFEALRERFCAEYPRAAVDAFLGFFFSHGGGYDNYDQDAFGRVYADMQVYLTQRGFIHDLLQSESHDQDQQWLYRYRIEHRLNCNPFPPSWGVTHGTDLSMWFWGNDADTSLLSMWEKEIVRRALLDPFAQFLRREELDWGSGSGSWREMRVLRLDGGVEIVEDGRWDEAVALWGVL